MLLVRSPRVLRVLIVSATVNPCRPSLLAPTMTDTALYTESKQTVLAYNNKRSWFRLQCYDHPGYIDRREDAYDGADKVKVWCKACFKQRVAAEQAEDARSGRPARETKDIEVACERSCSCLWRYSTNIHSMGITAGDTEQLPLDAVSPIRHGCALEPLPPSQSRR